MSNLNRQRWVEAERRRAAVALEVTDQETHVPVNIPSVTNLADFANFTTLVNQLSRQTISDSDEDKENIPVVILDDFPVPSEDHLAPMRERGIENLRQMELGQIYDLFVHHRVVLTDLRNEIRTGRVRDPGSRSISALIDEVDRVQEVNTQLQIELNEARASNERLTTDNNELIDTINTFRDQINTLRDQRDMARADLRNFITGHVHRRLSSSGGSIYVDPVNRSARQNL